MKTTLPSYGEVRVIQISSTTGIAVVFNDGCDRGAVPEFGFLPVTLKLNWDHQLESIALSDKPLDYLIVAVNRIQPVPPKKEHILAKIDACEAELKQKLEELAAERERQKAL